MNIFHLNGYGQFRSGANRDKLTPGFSFLLFLEMVDHGGGNVNKVYASFTLIRNSCYYLSIANCLSKILIIRIISK